MKKVLLGSVFGQILELFLSRPHKKYTGKYKKSFYVRPAIIIHYLLPTLTNIQNKNKKYCTKETIQSCLCIIL